MNAFNDVITRFKVYLINPLIILVFAAGFFFFVYGLVEFMWKLSQGADTKEGKQHMIWGIVGMVIMASTYGILSLVTGTFGIDYQNPDTTTPINVNVTGPFQ
jgi:hypothetical protein